jgi:pilus assembly protein CpaB
MNRKWVGVGVAVLLAAVGTWVLVSFVSGAENRALEGQETVAVLVVDTVISKGSAAEDIAGNVHVELVPANVQVRGSMADLEALQSLEGLVASVDLLPGEQVIASRFVAMEALDDQDRVEVPDGMVEVALSLSPERAVGGALRPGDEVAVFASFEPETVDTSPIGDSAETSPVSPGSELPSATHIILENVLITNVQVEELPASNTSEDSSTAALGLSPTGQLLITLALDPGDAERFVFSAEFGRVWLADAAVAPDGATTNVQDRTTVYDDPASGR